uniref:hypothetical protein n=1 Tax=Roseovarius sp. BRH_c41 TaxID=1629709 RepID=UPI0025D5384D|nr:hypothetical protein [Roseovarius sp. BRH_c41]
MIGRPKGKKRGGRHVQIMEYMQATEAWATMKPGPRALYIALKRLYNGGNNGEIFLSHREAAKALNVHRNSIGSYFAELQDRGFIRLATPPYLGPSGIGVASKWILEELPTKDKKPAGKAFMRWRKKQKPRTKSEPPRHNHCAKEAETPCKKALSGTTNVTQSANSFKSAAQ